MPKLSVLYIPNSAVTPYYKNNVVASLALFHALERFGVHKIVFSSSASVYASDPAKGYEVWEDSRLEPLSPYARTKVQVETMLSDICAAGPLKAISLRYFNPLGADPYARSGPQNNQVLGKLMEADAAGEAFEVTGTKWPTRDGTGLRDYVHVWDLAQAHVQAVEHFDEALAGSYFYRPINIGSGRGVTVRELVGVYERIVGHKVQVQDRPARPGDVAGAFANVDRAADLLRWEPTLTLAEAMASVLQRKVRVA